MKAVLDFLYSGVVNVTEEGVDEFLGVANDLKIEGLMVKHKKKRKPNKKVNNDKEQEQAKNGISKVATDDSSDEIEPTNSKKRKISKKSKDSNQEKKEDDQSAEDSSSEDEDVEINLINQKIKEKLSDAKELTKKNKETDIKKPKRKYTKRAKKTETESEDNEKMKRKKQNVASQNSLPRLMFPQSHTSTNLTTMLPQTFNCPVCKTRVVGSLKSHMEYTHRIQCQDCQQTFGSCNKLHHHKKGNCLTQNVRGHLDF